MSNDFDELPVYDELVEQGTNRMSNIWVGALSFFIMNIKDYLTQDGILLPHLTTTERDQLDSPQNGQMIYNTTLDTAQYFKAGAWVSF